jgi:hypothetical protein
MSHLKLYSPDEPALEEAIVDDAFPATIPFESASRDLGRRRFLRSRMTGDLVSRARAMRSNQSCPHCHHATVEPIELGDAIISARNHRPSPGTATVVGFHCHSCKSEWPVYHSSPESA